MALQTPRFINHIRTTSLTVHKPASPLEWRVLPNGKKQQNRTRGRKINRRVVGMHAATAPYSYMGIIQNPTLQAE